MYEFICGYVPFGEDEQDLYKIYERILKENLTFPPYVSKMN